MSGPEYRREAERLLKLAAGASTDVATSYAIQAQAYATLATIRPGADRPGLDPSMIALATAYTEAFSAGNKADVKWHEKTGDYEATVWKGLSCKSAICDSPAEALTEAARALADWLWEPDGEVRS